MIWKTWKALNFLIGYSRSEKSWKRLLIFESVNNLEIGINFEKIVSEKGYKP